MKITILSLLISLFVSTGCGTQMDVNSINKAKATPLHIAAEEGDVKIAKLRIKTVPNVNSKAGYYNTTPLYSATRNDACLGSPCTISPGVKKNQVKIVALLIKHGAEVNAKLRDGSTALSGAAICNAVDVAQLLIDSGADLNHRGHQYTALEIASSRGPDVAILMIKKGAKVNTFDYYTKTSPLHTAAKCGHRKLVKVLLQHGADMNVKDQWGLTPLDKAKDPIIIDLIKRYIKKNK